MRRRKKPVARPARVIAFKASPDADRDILTWWESLPDGERSEALRTVIRLYLGSSAKKDAGYQPRPGSLLSDSTSQIAEDTAWIRASLMDLPDYLTRLVERVGAARPPIGAKGESASAAEPEQPRMEDEAMQRRRDKMKRSQW